MGDSGCGTLTERYLEQRAKMYQSPQALSFFEEQMEGAEELLAEREAALEALPGVSRHHDGEGAAGSDSLATQKNLVMERLSRIQNELADAEVEMKESQYRVAI